MIPLRLALLVSTLSVIAAIKPNRYPKTENALDWITALDIAYRQKQSRNLRDLISLERQKLNSKLTKASALRVASNRGKREVVVVEKGADKVTGPVWLPHSNQHEREELHSLEKAPITVDKTTGRGTRGTNDNQWIRLSYAGHEDNDKDQSFPAPDLVSSRVPRIDFVTQNKRLDSGYEASEVEAEKEAVPKVNINRKDEELRTDFVYSDNRARGNIDRYKLDTEPRNADMFYPERRNYIDVPMDDLRRIIPYKDFNGDRYYPRRGSIDPPPYDQAAPRKSRRILYYANLPEVVRTPPIVDMRSRYHAVDPYRRYDDYYNPREARVYDFQNYRSRYPHRRHYREDEKYLSDRDASTWPPNPARDRNPGATDSTRQEKEVKVEKDKNMQNDKQPAGDSQHNANLPLRIYDEYPYKKQHKYYADSVRPAYT